MSIYSQLYALLSEYLFYDVLTEPHIELCLSLLCTLGCVLVFAIPFFIVFRLMRLFLCA